MASARTITSQAKADTGGTLGFPNIRISDLEKAAKALKEFDGEE